MPNLKDLAYLKPKNYALLIGRAKKSQMPEWIDINLIAIIFKFYGADWLAMLFTMLQLHLLGCKKINGFKFGIISNFFWMIFAVQVGSIANILANCVFLCINLKGLHSWKEDHAMPIESKRNFNN